MNSKHLATGSSCPQLIPGSLRIYSMRFCPYAQRALLAAAAKGIKYDVVNINLVEKPEFIFLKNPDGKVPTIETCDGKLLYESLIVSDYIDEVYNIQEKSAGDSPPRYLNQSDPFLKALDRLWIENFSKISSLDYQLYFSTNLEPAQISDKITDMNKQLMIFEAELQRRGTKFFSGKEKPGMLDYMIWPWMERLPSLPLMYKNEASQFEKGWQACPSLKQWEQAMIEDPAVKESYLSPEIHAEYREVKRQGGPPHYDFLHSKPEFQ